MDNIPNLSTAEDWQAWLEKQQVDSTEYQTLVKDAWKKLYNEGYAVDGEHVDRLLKDESLVPTEVWMSTHATFKHVPNIKHAQNTFSLALRKFGLNIFKILTVNILHELELGVGKGVFIHLIQMLKSIAPHLVHTLNKRCVKVRPLSMANASPYVLSGSGLWPVCSTQIFK